MNSYLYGNVIFCLTIGVSQRCRCPTGDTDYSAQAPKRHKECGKLRSGREKGGLWCACVKYDVVIVTDTATELFTKIACKKWSRIVSLKLLRWICNFSFNSLKGRKERGRDKKHKEKEKRSAKKKGRKNVSTIGRKVENEDWNNDIRHESWDEYLKLLLFLLLIKPYYMPSRSPVNYKIIFHILWGGATSCPVRKSRMSPSSSSHMWIWITVRMAASR